MKYFLLFFLSLTPIYAVSNDIISLYRTKGIAAVEEEIENQLKSKTYWNNTIKEKQILNGYYESIDHVILCQKDIKNIIVYDTKENTNIFQSSVFVGKRQGDKKIEGDYKTPIGVYSLTQRINSLDPFYGPLALVTNYPNTYDKSLKKTGHGIWIHGLPFKQKRDDYTKGCIALDNNKLEKLDTQIDIKKSILVVSEKNLYDVSKEDISMILSNIFQWKDAWQKNNIVAYLSFYSKDFKKTNGESLDHFAQYKKRLFNKKEKKKIIFSNINIIPYPNQLDKKYYKVIMDENYKTKSYKFTGKKELYLEIFKNKISILAEK